MAADHPLPYTRPTDPGKRHSHALTDGPDRAGARAMLKAVGFTDDDLAQPIVGVATSWIETMPCNLNQRRLAESVKAGIRAAGGTPMEFNTIAVCDGVSMGTEGMKASLISREVIADSIELVARGHLFDGIVCLVGCDKTIPAGAMALARLDIPGLVLYNGTIYPGTYKGEPADIVIGVRGDRRLPGGKITLEELYEVEKGACPGAGACGGQFTANTMATVLEFLGLSPGGLNGIPAEDPRKDDAARRGGRARHDARPPRHPARRHRDPPVARERDRVGRPRPAAAPTRRSTCRRSPPSSASRLTLDEFSEVADRTPLIADMRPGGRYAAADMYDAGGVGLVMRELLKRDLLHGDETTVDGRTIAQIAADTVETPGQAVVRPIETPIKATGGITDPPRPASRPTAASSSSPAHERRHHRGPARVFDSESACFEAVSKRRIVAGDVVVIRYEGPVGGPGMQEMLARHGRARRRGPGRVRRAAHRRPLLGRHARADDRPRRARGRGRRPDRARRGGRHRSSVDVDAKELNLEVDEATSSPSAAPAGRPPAPRYTTGRAGQVRGARLARVRGRDHERRGPAAGARAPHRRPAARDRAARRPASSASGSRSRPSRTGLDWATLDATWRCAGELAAFDGALDERPPDRHGPGDAPGRRWRRSRPLAALAHRVPGQVGRHRGALEHVPPPGAAREGRDGPRPRDRRPVRPRAGRRLVRGRARRRSGSRCRRCGERFDRFEIAPSRCSTALFSRRRRGARPA